MSDQSRAYVPDPQAIIDAAKHWVAQISWDVYSHPRMWADDHDFALIRAVLGKVPDPVPPPPGTSHRERFDREVRAGEWGWLTEGTVPDPKEASDG